MSEPNFIGYYGDGENRGSRGPGPNRGNILDWGAITETLSGSIKSVDEARKARRAENDRIMKESERMLNETEQAKSQTLNQFVLKGADQGRAKLYEWNKQLKSGDLNPEEYKIRVANLNDYWSSLASATKSLDQRLTQAMERQQVGPDGQLPPASQIEAEMQMYFGGLANIKDKNIVIGEDGRVQIGKYDQGGNLLSTEDVKYINNPANVVFNRTDVSGMVAADIKNWGDWSIGRVSDMRNNPQFKKAKARLMDAIVGTPRSAASILVDNTDGDYQVFFNEEDRQNKLAQLKYMSEQIGEKKSDEELAKQLIMMKQDANGDYQPILTEDQVDEARKIVDPEIELQVGRKVEPSPYYGGNNGPSYGDMRDAMNEEEDNLRGYIASREAWTKSDFSGLRSGFRYEREGTGDNYKIKVYKINANPSNRDAAETLWKTIENPEGLAEFAYHGDQNANIRKYHDGRSLFHNRGMQNDSRFSNGSGNSKSSQNMSESEWSSKWSKLKKGQSMVGLDGKTYTKQ